MYFNTPIKELKENYISDKIFFDNINDYICIKANKNIKKGEIILKEYPKINLFGEEEIDKGLQVIKKFIEIKESELYPRNYKYKKTKMIKDVHKIINSTPKLKNFFAKYSKEEIEFYYAKYIYNCFEGGKYGPLPLIITAKLNHSCNPNVEFYFDEQIGQMITITTRFINKGEEIFSSYLTKKVIKSHKNYLEEHYGFSCECKL
jgi:SET domain-containing protein